MTDISPNVNPTGMGVDDHHTRRIKTDARHNYPSTDNHGGTLTDRKEKKDAKHIFVILVHFAHCKVTVHRD